MSTLAENNLVRFISISKKKGGVFVNFKAKGIRGGTAFTASIVVDLSVIEVNPAEDSLEKIIEECAKVAVKEFKRSELEFEGITSV
ncbi:MAG: hypothetical protein K0S07_415 [Chlamydiales bacterium]|jgi:hypothetical protein|nr:hypothetical protein [Chlamydiales bacterium]